MKVRVKVKMMEHNYLKVTVAFIILLLLFLLLLKSWMLSWLVKSLCLFLNSYNCDLYGCCPEGEIGNMGAVFHMSTQNLVYTYDTQVMLTKIVDKS